MYRASTPLFVLSLALINLVACATTPAGSQHDSFADYAEAVFKHQNQLISRLMLLADSDQPIEDEEFETKEQAMHDACQLLNEYAEHEISGDDMSWRFKMKVQDSIKNCDDSVLKLESLVAKLVKDHPF
jgi:hypothetical protein